MKQEIGRDRWTGSFSAVMGLVFQSVERKISPAKKL